MGLMRFRVLPTERITDEMIEQAYLSGVDRVSWPVRTSIEGGVLGLQRSVSDSANLHIPWPIEGYGPLTLTSATLMERAEPYGVPLELARGTLVQVRNQISEWQVIGLSVPPTVSAKVTEAVERFSWAVVTQEEPAVSAGYADAALGSALAAGDMLAAAYCEQALIVRRRNGGKVPCLLGANLGATLLDNYASKQVLLTFNAAEVPIRWRDTETTEGNFSWTISDMQIEWCRAHGLKVLGGPLLMFDPTVLPDSFYLFEDDFESVQDFVLAYVQAVVERYRGKVDYWICAGRVNTAEILSLSEPERLRLVARTVDLVQSLDPDTPALVSFDQPWASYMRQRESDFPPLHFADALLRAGLGLGGLMLEMNIGYWPGGTLLRPPLEFSRLLDVWSSFGVPLWLSVSAPSGHQADALAQHKSAVPAASWSPAAQQAWIARYVPLSLAKPLVQGVLWNQLCDNRPHDFPHGGLFDGEGKAKRSLRTLAAIRKAYLA